MWAKQNNSFFVCWSQQQDKNNLKRDIAVNEPYIFLLFLLYVDWGFTFVCNVKHGLWGMRLSTISVWLRVSFWLWWFKQVGLGPSDDAASLHCYSRLRPCMSCPPTCGRVSMASIWHAPSVSQQKEVLVFFMILKPNFIYLTIFLIFQISLSGQWHICGVTNS